MDEPAPTNSAAPARYPHELLYEAARLYYELDVNQAGVAQRLGVSRPTVSRLLAQARRLGVVEITVHPPADVDGLPERLARELGLEKAYVVPGDVSAGAGRAELRPRLADALAAARLQRDDVLLVSSGLTLYECAQGELPTAAGIVVAPTVGGAEEPQPWYQTNIIATMFAGQMGGAVAYLNAPALPAAGLRRSLRVDPSFQRVQDLWSRASCALVGVGAALATREAVPSFVPAHARSLDRAVGDICSRFYDAAGRSVRYPGSDRLVAIGLEQLRAIPSCIAVAAGADKVAAIASGARARYFNQLVTDAHTAVALLEQQPSM